MTRRSSDLVGRGLVAAIVTSVALAAPASASPAGPSVHLADLLPSAITSCPIPPAGDRALERRSLYVRAEDGTRLAVDVFLPVGRPAGAKLPTLYWATRYWRGRKGQPLDPPKARWIARGFAVVILDVRGTGASFGQWYIPYSPLEARDIGFVARWVARQAWSNGKVVMTGSSYPGTTPLMAAAYSGGALAAIAPRFADFDLYTDLLFPGGTATEALSLNWGTFVRSLDLNRAPEGPAEGHSASVRPVDGADGEALLAAAIKDHQKNPEGFDRVPYRVTYKDEPIEQYHGLAIEDGGVFRLRKAIEQSGVPMFGWGSWLDSGIAQGLLNRFISLRNPQLTIIGPWTHGAREDVNVFNATEALDPSRDAQDDMIFCFLRHYALTPRAPAIATHTLVYFTMGEDRWKSTSEWPISTTRRIKYYFENDHGLSAHRPEASGEDSYDVDFDASAGPANRWATQADGPRIDYGDRASADARLLSFTSAPLLRDAEITGQPVVTLRIASTHRDGNIIVYLEDVDPAGRVTYLTEGVLRAIHRKLSVDLAPYETTYLSRSFHQRDAAPLVPGEFALMTFQLQATSVLVRHGHRLRVSIAGADSGTFLRIPALEEGPVTLRVSHGGDLPSFIDLPIVPR